MLRGIDPLIGPELLYSLAQMGHGDELAIVDRNFPAYSVGQRVHRIDVDAARAAAAILSLFPLDSFVEHQVLCMEVIGSGGARNEVQNDVLAVACDAAGREVSMGSLERFAFYERTKQSFAVVQTTEDRPFGCFILSKGVLPDFTP